ncbi:MAG: amidophosphoribosyltransferase [Desulfobacteraceae bacterium]|nr:MAG: amidophosphoribosyltransferase [Desulfobacteraceae bacterium]
MCAIAGILFKHSNRTFNLTTGEALTLILDSTVHRGMDSCGWALYKDPMKDTIRMRFFIPTDETAESEIKRIEYTLSAHQVTILSARKLGCTLGVHAGFSGDLLALTRAIEKDLKPVSMGTRLDILKDVGMPYEVAPVYNIGAFNGSHGIAHNRLATESGVRPETAHPFWACGFSDIATVHNGQITNYWIMRRRLERKGMVFQTENDTELVAVYLAYQMRCNMSLEDSLKASLDDLDGTFSYLVATKDSIGYAKDKLAAKPMVKYENDEMIVIASEEVGINRLFPGKSLETTEPAPLTYGLWSLAS